MTICSLLTGSRPSPCSHTADASRSPRPPARTCRVCHVYQHNHVPRATCIPTTRHLPCSTRMFFTVTMSPGAIFSRMWFSGSFMMSSKVLMALCLILFDQLHHDCPHLVELLHRVEVTVQVGVPGEVRPVDPLQSAVVVVSEKQLIVSYQMFPLCLSAAHMRKGFCVILSYWM